MPSLTLKKIPEDLLERLRSLADEERRSINQQAILLLEKALEEKRPSFTDAYEGFRKRGGTSPLDDDSFEAVFEGIRSREYGRASPFDDETVE